jgi:hypothetical protein
MRPALAMLALVALSACATRRPVPAQPLLSLADGTLTYNGPILRHSFDQLQAAVGSQPVRTLKIRSGGGDVEVAIRIARWVHANGIDVVVDGNCFSSCANYIFPAGNVKYIVGDGILGWHGTIEHRLYQHAHGLRGVEKSILASFEKTAAKERQFYADLGLNGYIAWFGKLAPYKAHNMYFLSKEDMEYFGLKSLHVRDNYLASDLSRLNAREKRTMTLITVDRAVTNPSDPNWGRQ